MSALPEAVSLAAQASSESQQVVLAHQVEHARRYLLETLLKNSEIATYISGQLLADLQKGTDYSDILLIKNNESYKDALHQFIAEFAKQSQHYNVCDENSLPSFNYNVVQDYNLVQVSGQSLMDDVEVSATALQIMQGLHFLSVYLIDVSELVERQLLAHGKVDQLYRTKLRAARAALKELRQDMISSNTGLVAFVAHKYKTSTLTFDDLMQEGTVGLIKAVDRFDPDRGNCFSTYAIYWIRQAISRLIVKQDKVVPLPVALAEKSAPVFEVMRNTFLQSERWPTFEELKASCDLSEHDIKTISSYYQSTYMPDTSANEDEDGMTVMERMQQSQFSQPIDDLIDTDLASYMSKAVASLPEKQATILSMRFGLKNQTEMTLQAVADQLQVTRERVRQIQNEALQKLRQQFGFDLMLFLEPKDT